MSTVAEIEAAIEKLPAEEFAKLLAWMEEYQALIGASQDLFAMYDEEERNHGQSFDAQGLGSIPDIKLERRLGLLIRTHFQK
jgi:hypothetical protein